MINSIKDILIIIALFSPFFILYYIFINIIIKYRIECKQKEFDDKLKETIKISFIITEKRNYEKEFKEKIALNKKLAYKIFGETITQEEWHKRTRAMIRQEVKTELEKRRIYYEF